MELADGTGAMTEQAATTATGRDSILRGLAALHAGDREPTRDPAFWTALDRLADEAGRDPAPMPDGLVARPCALSGAAWHVAALKVAMASPPDAVSRPRTGFHARWLGWFLSDGGTDWMPRVSIVIPVYNRATIAPDAVASAVAQTYPAVETIVVDDGSTDDLAAALAPFEGHVRILRQANKGVSAARNAGIAAASGEYIHFLDSDDMLHPDCVADKMAAFRAVPDAEICTSYALAVDRDGVQRWFMGPPFLNRKTMSPANDLLRAVCWAQPIRMSTLMIARWRVAASGGFEEDLRQKEDTRFIFRLGLQHIKVAGWHRRLTLKRVFGDSLYQVRLDQGATDGVTRLRSMTNLIDRPGAWRYLPEYYIGWSVPRYWRRSAFGAGRYKPGAAGAAFIERIESWGDGARVGGRSPLPVLALIRLVCATILVDDPARSGNDEAFWPRVDEAAARALADAALLEAGDIAYWRSAREVAFQGHPLIALFEAFVPTDAPTDDVAALDAFLRAPPVPISPASWRAYARAVARGDEDQGRTEARAAHFLFLCAWPARRARDAAGRYYARAKRPLAPLKGWLRRRRRKRDLDRFAEPGPLRDWAEAYWRRADAGEGPTAASLRRPVKK